jgi:hypothetical protein
LTLQKAEMLDVADVEECSVEDRGIKGEARGERKLNTRI